MIKHTLHKSEKNEEGKYQILEHTNDFPEGRTCGVYFKKKDAMEDLENLNNK